MALKTNSICIFSCISALLDSLSSLVSPAGLTMGCVRSKEDKGPALKYRPDNANNAPVNAHLGHYGPEPTLMGHSPAAKTLNSSYNSHASALTPFGGASSAITPFGGASTSFTSVAVSSPFPGVVTGQFTHRCGSRLLKPGSNLMEYGKGLGVPPWASRQPVRATIHTHLHADGPRYMQDFGMWEGSASAWRAGRREQKFKYSLRQAC